MRTTAEAVVGIPQLVFLTPIGFLQGIRAEHQHFTGKVLLGPISDAMLGAKQPQLLVCLPIEVYESIQYGRMASDDDSGIVPLLMWNVVPRRPLPIGEAETLVPRKLLQRSGKHPLDALAAVFCQHGLDAFLFQVHSVEVLTDRLLDGLAAGDVCLMALPPEFQFISFIRFSR